MGEPEALDEMQRDAQQAVAVKSAEQALAAAFAGLVEEDMQLLKEPGADAGGLTIVYQVRDASWP